MNATGDINRVFAGGNSANNGVSSLGSGTPEVTVFVNNANPAAHVGTLFGGNNKVAMEVVPDLLLMQGTIGTIYGGGNQGAMAGAATVRGQSVSTYVGIASPQMTVTDIYGGCNVADVVNNSFVYVENGAISGNVFGGNDIAGSVGGESYVIVNGASGWSLNGNIFGGGNGSYTYTPEAGNNSYSVTTPNGTYTGLAGRPYVAAATDSIIGSAAYTLNGIVYGGGLAGDCGTTRVVVNSEGAAFNNMIFGGGRGDVDNIGNGCTEYAGYLDGSGSCTNNKHVGNVTGTAYLELIKMGGFTGNKIYGGGHNGDVNNVELSMVPSQTVNIPELYGGCLASDVTGTAHTLIDGYTTDDENTYIVDALYGGNDYSGKVENTVLDINSGRFFHVYGAGNGDYDYRGELSLTTVPDAAQQAAGFSATAADDGRYWKYYNATSGLHCQDTVPYSMTIEVNFNGGEFMHTVYGGGNMGLVGNRDMNPSDMLRTVAATTREENMGLITVNIHGGNFYRHVFGGARGRSANEMSGKYYFALNTFDVDGAGAIAAGKNVENQDLGRQLAYATKIVNMDGGVIKFSLYGGSEAVDDGFPYECINNTGYETHTPANYTQTTMRPSSILNITGGTVNKSVYGGGYQGNIYGSVYVNIGAQAIEDSYVWSKTYGTGDGLTFNMASLKPTIRYNNTTTSNTDLHVRNTVPLTLGASVYGASDWGEASDNAYFNTRGVFGGETNILIDGKNYNTSITNSQTDKPVMNITYNIIGAGTSTAGGDMNSMITLRRYGDYDCPNPSRSLYSIQRADKVVLDSAFITLKGDNDAFQSYVTPSYSLCRIDTLIFRYDNIVMIESPAIYIGNLVSLESRDEAALTNFAENGNYNKLQNTHWKADDDETTQFRTYAEENTSLAHNFYKNMIESNDCDHVDVCMKLPTLRGTADKPGNFNVLMMRNGSYMKVSPFIDDNADGLDDDHVYGTVYGFMFLLAQDNTKSYVYAREKTALSDAGHGSDGGFVSPCSGENVDDVLVNTNGQEVGYTNVPTGNGVTYPYRSWTVGTQQGTRTRHITLVANVTPDNVLNYNLSDHAISTDDHDTRIGVSAHGTATEGHIDLTTSDYSDLAFATATLELPPSSQGSFYLINSVIIDQDNGGQLTLVDEAYYNNMQADAYNDKGVFALATQNQVHQMVDINNDPNYTFGLTFSSVGNNNFNTDQCWLESTALPGVSTPVARTFSGDVDGDANTPDETYPCWPRSIISGSRYLTQNGGYISSAIANGTGVIPTINFTLTYSKNITKTIMRDVTFTMYEYDAQGNYIGPIDVTVTISTVIRNFSDLEVPTLAMYNDGLYNEYVRKISIPASFKQRDLYLKAINWYPNENATIRGEITNDATGVRFQLQDTATAIEDNNHFSIVMRPTEASSDNLNSSLGWYNIEQDSRNMDLYRIAEDDYKLTTGSSTGFTSSVVGTLNQNSLYNSLNYDGESHGSRLSTKDGMWLVGTLDGRASASIDVQLNFDGLMVYNDHFNESGDNPPGPLGWVDLTMYWENTQDAAGVSGPEKSGEFHIKIKVRSRMQGDTIYVAPNESLTRIPTGATASNVSTNINGGTPTQNDNGFTIGADGSITLYSYESRHGGVDFLSVYSTLSTDAANGLIHNHPENYLQNLKAAMDIYQEGDVISVMEAMPIESSANPISIIGDDYSIIQIIRYSGNHYLFPTLGCANTGAVLDVKGSGFLTMRNVWLNGSGCTRAKAVENTSRDGKNYIKIGNKYYNDAGERKDSLLASQWPMVLVHGGGDVNFSRNVRLSNNFNNYDETGTVGVDGMYGGAMALVEDDPANAPSIILGDKNIVYDNLVVDWNQATPGGTESKLPLNYGGGIFVDGGVLTLGTGGPQATVNINRNFYLDCDVATSTAGVASKTMKLLDGSTYTFNVYYLDTTTKAEHYALSNVHLTRTPYTGYEVQLDEKSDVIYFISELTDSSRVGISKWFPGYVYDNTGNRLYCDTPRDTIMVATLGSGKSDATMVENVFKNKVFFNDSSYFTTAGTLGTDWIEIRNNENQVIGYERTQGHPSFQNIYPRVWYDEETSLYSDYNDNVWVFEHQMVNPYIIYFQRCATFSKGIALDEPIPVNVGTRQVYLPQYVNVDSIIYRWNSEATCVASTDSLFLRVGGGFFPYTYNWYNVSDTTWSSADHSNLANISEVSRTLQRSRETYGGNYISNFAVDAYHTYRDAAQCDTFMLRNINVGGSDNPVFAFQAEVTDATGNCHVTQPVRVKVVKVTGGDNYTDDANFLFNGTDYAIQALATVDSSSFHDKEGFIHVNTAGTRTTYANLAGATTVNSPYEPRYLRIYRGYKVMPSIYPAVAFNSPANVHIIPSAGTGEYTVYSNTTENDVITDFCPGDVVTLVPTPASASYEYMAWSHDPTSAATTTFVVRDDIESNKPIVYYSPNEYWYQHVTSRPGSYQVAYNGDVTITGREGLAWLISVVNGYNGHNAETFRFNTITLDFDSVDMSKYKWTPVGDLTNHFEGTIQVADGKKGIVGNLIVNESTIPNVGMFGYTEQANISGLRLNNVFMRGPSYVGGLVGHSANGTTITDVHVPSTVLFGQYCLGGLVAQADNTNISGAIIGSYDQTEVGALFSGVTPNPNTQLLRMMGGAIYAGGVVGKGSADTIQNWYTGNPNTEELTCIYYAAGIGYNEGTSGKSAHRSVLRNGYGVVNSSAAINRVGGLVGRAEGIDMSNCYAYGEMKYSNYGGGLVGYLGDGVNITNCYYVDGMSSDMVGYNSEDTPVLKSTTFHGTGNQVILTEPVDGYNNMTRALNKWVQAQNDNSLLTWRSDLDDQNNGYPVFGDPDMIPVFDTLQTASCEEYEFDGLLFYESGNYVFHVVDSADYLDSTFTLMLTINHGDSTAVSDTVAWGDAYEGYGFSFTANDLMMSSNTVRNSDVYALHFVDSLFTVNGCDSVVTLTLYVMHSGVDVPEVMQQLSDVKVYPNPTRGVVHVEGSGLQRVETYDASGKKLGEKAGDAADNSIITLDLHGQASGAYYLRVQTTHGTVVKKVIKK